MAAFGWHSLSNENNDDEYAVARFEVIKDVEGFGDAGHPGEAYLDSATPAKPTITA